MRSKPLHRPLLFAAAVLTVDRLSKLAVTALHPGTLSVARTSFGPFGIAPVANPHAVGGADLGLSDVLPQAALITAVVLIGLSRRSWGFRGRRGACPSRGGGKRPRSAESRSRQSTFFSVELGVARVILNVADLALFAGILMLVVGAGRSSGRSCRAAALTESIARYRYSAAASRLEKGRKRARARVQRHPPTETLRQAAVSAVVGVLLAGCSLHPTARTRLGAESAAGRIGRQP